MLGQALVFRKDETGDQVGNNRCPDGQITQAQFQLQTIEHLRNGDRDQLPGQRNPAQHDHGAQSDPIGAGAARKRPDVALRHSHTFCLFEVPLTGM